MPKTKPSEAKSVALQLIQGAYLRLEVIEANCCVIRTTLCNAERELELLSRKGA